LDNNARVTIPAEKKAMTTRKKNNNKEKVQTAQVGSEQAVLADSAIAVTQRRTDAGCPASISCDDFQLRQRITLYLDP
jgi:hypothetical protein